ncbi:DUF2268 domain-containing putative Zn-dependent protease [Lysinibacillus sp. NPDC093712]|uniref:DUF2268 domain-containing putative Zn-dependent protease n=1 Tax=Lysinibacillus sp. NPDC093712 TaxID=3390579 RepID=UPI003D093AAE
MKNYQKTVVIFLLIITLLTLTSCTQAEESKEKQGIESIVLSFEHPQTGQKFKIVNAYKLYQKYADKVEINPEQLQSEIYNEEVIKPIHSACFENVEYPYMADSILNVAADLLTENQILSEKIDREKTENIIKEALLKSSNLIPSENETTVCVFPATNTNKLMTNLGAGKIIVHYNKDYTEDDIRSSMPHEYHHSVWTEKYFRNAPPFTVLDNLIFEGKAIMFNKLVYPDIDYDPIHSTFNKYYWSKIALDLETVDLNRSLEILAGGNGLPSRYGYGEGYRMVKSYLDLHPNVTPEEWTALSAKEIFEKGNYLENYK